MSIFRRKKVPPPGQKDPIELMRAMHADREYCAVMGPLSEPQSGMPIVPYGPCTLPIGHEGNHKFSPELP